MSTESNKEFEPVLVELETETELQDFVSILKHYVDENSHANWKPTSEKVALCNNLIEQSKEV